MHRHPAAGGAPLPLLTVEPLYDAVRGGDDLVWYVDAPRGAALPRLVITMEKVNPAPWGKTLSKDGGTLECWEHGDIVEKKDDEDPLNKWKRDVNSKTAGEQLPVAISVWPSWQAMWSGV